MLGGVQFKPIPRPTHWPTLHLPECFGCGLLAFRLQSAKLESIFNSTRYLLIFTIDQKFNVTSVNQNIVEVLNEQFGFETIVFILELLKEVFPRSSIEGSFVVCARSAGYNSNLNCRWSLSKGRLCGTNCSSASCNTTRHQELSCIAYDITERKRLTTKSGLPSRRRKSCFMRCTTGSKIIYKLSPVC